MDARARNAAYKTIRTLLGDDLTKIEAKVLDMRRRDMCYVDMATKLNKTRRGKNKPTIGPMQIDNALCRVMKKVRKIEIEIAEFFDDNF